MNELIITNPNGNADAIAATRRMLIDREAEFVAQIDAAAGTATAKNRLNAFDDYKSMFADAGKKLAAEIAAQCGADAIFTQLAASETAVKSAIKRYQEAVRTAKEADEIKAEKQEYIVELCVTEKDYLAISKRLIKDGVEFRARRVKDNESAKIGKLFD